jgi:ribosomal protein L37AE/L43A
MEEKFCVQVTSYCDEGDLTVWRKFLEDKGFETTTKSEIRKNTHGVPITRHALFRNLSPEEVQEIVDNKIRISSDYSIIIKQDVKTIRDMKKNKYICISCGDPYERINCSKHNGLCKRCKAYAKTDSGYTLRQTHNRRKAGGAI